MHGRDVNEVFFLNYEIYEPWDMCLIFTTSGDDI